MENSFDAGCLQLFLSEGSFFGHHDHNQSRDDGHIGHIKDAGVQRTPAHDHKISHTALP